LDFAVAAFPEAAACPVACASAGVLFCAAGAQEKIPAIANAMPNLNFISSLLASNLQLADQG
jgi:hypothetical protein